MVRGCPELHPAAPGTPFYIGHYMRLPAEWERQSGIQLTWPHADTEWYQLEKVLDCYVEIAFNILRFEPLMIVCRNREEARMTPTARAAAMPRVSSRAFRN